MREFEPKEVRSSLIKFCWFHPSRSVTKDNIGKDLHWKLGRYRICVGITMTFVFRNRPLVIGDLGMKFTNTGFMFRNPVVNVFHCQAIEMCVGYDIVKREDVKTTTEVALHSTAMTCLKTR